MNTIRVNKSNKTAATVEEILAIIQEVASDTKYTKAYDSMMQSFTVEVKMPYWACEATIYIRNRGSWETVTYDEKTYSKAEFESEISWSSTRRSLSYAAVAIDLYQKTLLLAQTIEVALSRIDLIERS